MLPLIVIFIPAVVIWLLKNAFDSFSKSFDVRGKVVLITGASSGLGEACAWKFAEAGAKVILCARNITKLQAVKDKIIKKIDQAEVPEILYLDLNDEEKIEEMVDSALKLHGHIDIVINNAGISYRGKIEDTDIEVQKNLMKVNYFGAVIITKALLPSMIERKQGHIVAVSSVQGKISVPYRSAYSASKHACEAFFNCLRSEVAASNIHVTIANPGYIRTNLSLNAMTSDGGSYGVLDKTTANGMDPNYVAAEILNSVERRKEQLVLADFKVKIGILLNCIFPSLFYKIMKRRAKKEMPGKVKGD